MEDVFVDGVLNALSLDKRYRTFIENILFSVIPGWILAPYLFLQGLRYQDIILRLIAVSFFIADTYMMWNRIYAVPSDKEPLSRVINHLFPGLSPKAAFKLIYMGVPIFFGTYILWVGIQKSNILLVFIGLGIMMVDLYHSLK